MSNFSDFTGGEIPVWVSGRTYAAGKSVRSPANNYLKYVRTVAGAGTTDPSSDTANWKPDGGRSVKSTQRGTAVVPNGAFSQTVTISAVDVSKSELRHLGGSGFNSGGTLLIPSIVLTNSTTVTVNANGQVAGVMSVGWELTEYY